MRNCTLIPTARVPLTSLHRDEILAAEQLPLQYTAYTPCFRKEAVQPARIRVGYFRQHQFEKVELVWLNHAGAFVRRSRDAERRMSSGLLQELGLAHRTMLLAAGDTGFTAPKTYGPRSVGAELRALS